MSGRVKVFGPEVKRLEQKHVNQAVRNSDFKERQGNIEFYAHQTTEAVDPDAFKGCRKFLAVVHLPSVLTIEPSTFSGRGVLVFNALKEVSMPSVNHIGRRAFSDCYRLEIIHPLLNAVTIGNFAFSGCSRLKIDIGEVFPQILGVGNFAFSKSDVGAKMLKIKGSGPGAANRIGPFAFAGRKIEHIVSENVTIQCEAFKDCHDLKSVKLTKCITHAESFSRCENLKTVLLKDVQLTNLVDYGETPRGDYSAIFGSFDNCSELNTLHVDGSLTMVSRHDDPGHQNNPFYGCNIKRVVLHGHNHEFAPSDKVITFQRQQDPIFLTHSNIRTVAFHCSMLDDQMRVTRWLLPADVPAARDEYDYENKQWDHNLVLERDKAKLIVMPMDTTLETERERQQWARRDKTLWDRNYSAFGFPVDPQDDVTDWALTTYFNFYMQEIPFKLTNNRDLENGPSNSYFRPARLARFISELAFPPRPILPGVGAKDQVPEKPGERKAKHQVPENPNDFPVLFVRMAKLIADAFGACPEDRYHPLLVQTVKKVDRRARRALIYFIGRTAPRAFHLLHIAYYGRPEKDYVPEIRGRRDFVLPDFIVRMILDSLLDLPFTPEQRRAIRTVYEGDGKDVRRQLEDKAERTQTKSAMLLANPVSRRSTGIATPLFAICASDGPRN